MDLYSSFGDASPKSGASHLGFPTPSKSPVEGGSGDNEIREIEVVKAKWVSPVESRKRRRTKDHRFLDPFARCPDTSFELDCASSMVSLDFGLVSPKKNWSSPPQRIERADNREWSPHHVIDRPNPENSPGNWISLKESCQQSLPLGEKNSEPRSVSQSTYILPERVQFPVTSAANEQPARKTSVLVDYEPERPGCVLTKKRPGNFPESTRSNFEESNDKVRRVVEPDGRIVKISVLDDFQVPSFGKVADKNAEETEKENLQTDSRSKILKSGPTTKVKSSKTSTKKPSSFSKKKEEYAEEHGNRAETCQTEGVRFTPEKFTQDKDETKDETHKIITDMEKILREDKWTIPSETQKRKNERANSKKSLPKATEEAPKVVIEKKKRKVDAKVVQEFIKNKKQKRLEQIKTEQRSKVEEREARKKKLEELRIKTLKLAAQSKKKRAHEPPIKVVDPGTEDEITMSLGLKQIKPKVSYNESISNLKKKPTQMKQQQDKMELEPAAEEEDSNKSECDNSQRVNDVRSVGSVVKVDQSLKQPSDALSVESKSHNDLNSTLRKLAETLHLKIEEKEKQFRSRPTSTASKSVKDSVSIAPSQESVKTIRSLRESNAPMVTVDLETIQTLREDIRKISENFKVLHEIIIKKTDLNEKKRVKETENTQKRETASLNTLSSEDSEPIPDWLKSTVPQPYPYNVYMAIRQKMNLKMTKTPSTVSQESSVYTEAVSTKCGSDFEALSVPSDRLLSSKPLSLGGNPRTPGYTSEENYYSLREDSGSELSSSILDSEKYSEKYSGTSVEGNKQGFRVQSGKFTGDSCTKNSVTSSIITEVTSRSIRVASSKESITSKIPSVNFTKDKENLVLIAPDVRLITNDLNDKKQNNCADNLNVMQETQGALPKTSVESLRSVAVEELNNSGKRVAREQRSESTITEIIDNLSENDKSQKSTKTTNEKVQNAVQRVDEAHIRRSFFQPEMLHLQFQAELSLLETFQQSLSHFLEAERMKTLTEVNKIMYEKSINAGSGGVKREDQAVQTTFLEDGPVNCRITREEDEASESVKTEINISEEESTKSCKSESTKEVEDEGKDSNISIKNHREKGDEDSTNLKESKPKDIESIDFSNGHNGISFQMLNRMMKDEELRSEHQLALIRLREKTLNDKVKAELTFLEMKKRALKERGGDEEQNVPAIKKKQRGILLKYQSEKEEIERLKKMHKIASEERKIMIKQQKQIQQMQLSTKDMITKIRREKSPDRKGTLTKGVRSSDTQSDAREDISMPVSASILTDSVCSMDESTSRSNGSESEISSGKMESDEESEVLLRNKKAVENKVCGNPEKKSSAKEVEKYQRKRHSVEDLLNWTKRLEEKENHLKELERKAVRSSKYVKNRIIKALKTSMRDRSTSPFQFPESFSSVTENSPSAPEVIETKKSSTISEMIGESRSKTEATEKIESISEKLQNSVSEDITVQFPETHVDASASRTVEYNSESFESPSSSEAPQKESKSPTLRSKSLGTDKSCKGVPIKLFLSPRIQSPRRRYSSGSDDSLNFSHTETASEQSDLESRIAALHEQLRKRKLEAERLRREQMKAQRERLRVKEQSLLKQIQAYDAYIQKKKQELEQEYKNSSLAITKPQIKKPKVAEKSSLKRQEPPLLNENDKFRFYPRVLGGKAKDKDEAASFEKITESDSEIPEQIKDEATESIREDLESFPGNKGGSDSVREHTEAKTDEKDLKDLESSLEIESSLIEVSETHKSSNISESIPQPQPQPEAEVDGSQSGSEDQSVSIKTTLLSPEKPDTDAADSREKTEAVEVEDESVDRETNENTYQSDSFESDFEDRTFGQMNKERNESEMSDVVMSVPHVNLEKVEDEKEVMEKYEKRTEISDEGDHRVEVDNRTDTLSEIKSDISEDLSVERRNMEKAEAISELMVLDMISESVKMYTNKKAEAENKLNRISKIHLQGLSVSLADDIAKEAVEDILKIYNRKAVDRNRAEEPISPDRITSDVRRRICEIMSQSGGVKNRGRPQDIMVTTYDVTPIHTPPDVDESAEATERAEFLQSLTSTPKEEKQGQKVTAQAERDHRNKKSEVSSQEWFEDDYGLSRTRREAEELRLQQLQIEQEIQQLQAQQEHVPYFYLREIPNKPPPPYTPPGKPVSEIPTSEADIVALTTSAVRILTDEMNKGKSIRDIEPPRDFYGSVVNDHVKCYKFFLFDLAKHIIESVIHEQEGKKEVFPWSRTRERLSSFKYKRIERTLDSLNEFVLNQVLNLFGFGKKVKKESLITRCFKKKRDHVDEILVEELQEEESQWTQFEEDQLAVKNEVTTAILDGLLEESVHLLNTIFSKKIKHYNK